MGKQTKDWRQELQMFNAMCQISEEEVSLKRRNRRYGLAYPGKRMQTRSHIVVPIDCSASVNDQQLSQFMAELTSMKLNNVDITVVEFDTKVNQVYKFDPNTKIEVLGRGGTSFAPVFQHIHTPEFTTEYGNIDGIIFLTDGDNYDTDAVEEPDYPVLWGLLPNCNVKYSWGQKTVIEV